MEEGGKPKKESLLQPKKVCSHFTDLASGGGRVVSEARDPCECGKVENKRKRERKGWGKTIPALMRSLGLDKGP